MDPLAIYKEKFHIPNRDVDFMKRLRLGSLFGYIQDISSMHSESIGTGVARLLNDFGVAWILMRMRTDILRQPRLYEEVTLSTWPHSISGPLYGRDIVMYGDDGEIIIRGSAIWIIMNLEKRELIKEQLFDYPISEFPKESALPSKPGRIRMPDKGIKIFDRLVSYNDIDYNGHLNNTKYIDIVMDSIGTDLLRKYEPERIEVNYTNEIREGETLSLYKSDSSFADENAIYAEAKNAASGKSLFSGKITFRQVSR